MSELYESHNDYYDRLPVKIYKHDLKGMEIYAPLHWHKSLELTIPFSGRIRFNSCRNNFDFGEADWIAVNSCELHSCSCVNPYDSFTGLSILISPSFSDKWLGKNIMLYNPENSSVTAEIKAITAKLYVLDETIPGYSLIVMSCIFDLLRVLSEYCLRPCETGEHSIEHDGALTAQFSDYIEKHYKEDITLDSIAAVYNYSPSYFSRKFKENIGSNFISYLNFVRVCHCAEELMSSNSNMSECAYNNGFSNVKAFISAFKKVFGQTPSAYAASRKPIL